jgi:hypothetical protein
VLIIDEGVADWHGRAVVAGEEEERGFSLRTIIDARETVFGRGLSCYWAAAGLAWWAARSRTGEFPSLFSLFKFCFIFLFSILFLFTGLNSN